MTITYSLEVSTTQLAGFGKLLLRWRGSIYKLIYRELIIFTVAYYAIAMLYRLVLVRYENHKKNFESLSLYFRDFSGLIPMTFVMGFYVWLIIARWWSQYLNLPWPDRVVMAITTFIQGQDERGRMIRRTLARYLNIMAVLTLQAISTSVKRRFPTMDHLIEAGILMEEERAFLDSTASPHGNWFQPAVWFSNLAMQARKEGRIHDDIHLKTILDEMMSYRGCCGMLYSYDWISVPLAYTQVVTLAVYSFFAASLIGRQFLLLPPGESHSYILDEYIPLFTFIQFFFYMGWLKTAEELINPLGDDEDDFELNYLIDRNVQVGCLIADEMHKKYPKLQKDPFWDEPEPEIPYTAAAAETHRRPFLGSVVDLNIGLADSEWQAVPAFTPLKEMSIHSRMSRDSDASSGTDVGGRPDGKMHQLSPNAPNGLRRLLPDHTKVIRGSMHSLREARRRRRSRFAGSRLLGIRISGPGNSIASSRSVSHTGSRLGSQVSLNSSINHSFEAINNAALMNGGQGVEHRTRSNSNYQISTTNKQESSDRKPSKPQLFSFTKSSVDIIGKPIEDNVGEFSNDTLYPEKRAEDHIPTSANLYLSPPSYEAAIQADQGLVGISPNVMIAGLPISEPVPITSNISEICTPFFDAGSSLPPLEPIDEGCVFTVSTSKSPVIPRTSFQTLEVFSNDRLVGASQIDDGSDAGAGPDVTASLITIDNNQRVSSGETIAYVPGDFLTPSSAAPVFTTFTPYQKPITSPLATTLVQQLGDWGAANSAPTSSMPQLPSPSTDVSQSFAAHPTNCGDDTSLPLLSPLKPQRKASAPEPLLNASTIDFATAGDEKSWLLISEKEGGETNFQSTVSGGFNHGHGGGIVSGGNPPPSEGDGVALDSTANSTASSSMPWDAVSDSDSHTPLIPISTDSASLESVTERGGVKFYGDLGQEAAGVA